MCVKYVLSSWQLVRKYFTFIIKKLMIKDCHWLLSNQIKYIRAQKWPSLPLDRNLEGEFKSQLRCSESWRYLLGPITSGESHVQWINLNVTWIKFILEVWKVSFEVFSQRKVIKCFVLHLGGWESFWMRKIKGLMFLWSTCLLPSMLSRK